MTHPLVDSEGFPRADIDVFLVRTTRADIIRLSNDHKHLLGEIESKLHELHSVAHSQPSKSIENINKPWARIDAVAPDSPAAACGLQRDDLVVQFGSIHAGLTKPFQLLASFVESHENKTFDMTIQREGKLTVLAMTPVKWQGRGLLGCHLVPLVS